MPVLKKIRSIYPIPKDWENNDDRRSFFIRLDTMIRELFMHNSALKDEVAELPSGFIQYKRFYTTENKTFDVALPPSCTFLAISERAATTLTGTMGVWLGHTAASGGTSAALLALHEPSASTAVPSMSLTGQTLSITSGRTNTMFFTIMYATAATAK